MNSGAELMVVMPTINSVRSPCQTIFSNRMRTRVGKPDSAEGNDDVLQSFVRKMNINGIQSLDPSAMSASERPRASDIPLVPRPMSLSIAKIDVRAPATTGVNHHSASVSSDGGVIPLMTDRRIAPDHESLEPRMKKGREVFGTLI